MQVKEGEARALFSALDCPESKWNVVRLTKKLNDSELLVSLAEPAAQLEGDALGLYKRLYTALADEGSGCVELVEEEPSTPKETKVKTKTKAETNGAAPKKGNKAKVGKGGGREPSPLNDQIMSVMSKKPMSPKEIKEAASIPPKTMIFSNIKALMSKGTIVKVDDGYALAGKKK